jgi:hypothetical protein
MRVRVCGWVRVSSAVAGATTEVLRAVAGDGAIGDDAREDTVGVCAASETLGGAAAAGLDRSGIRAQHVVPTWRDTVGVTLTGYPATLCLR